MTSNPKQPKKDTPQSVKGMHDIIGKDFYALQGFLEKAAEVAVYYGFKPIETPILEHTEVFTSGVGEETDLVEKEMYSLRTKSGDQLALRPEGTAGVMRAYLEHGMQTWPQPVMLYYGGPFFRHDRPQKGRLRQFRQFGLEILGTEKSIGDAMVMKLICIILEESGLKNFTLEINSIGDKNCRHLYKKALSNHYKKHLSSICADCKRRYKDNPLRVLDCKDPKCQKVKETSPESISFLCEPCKTHFKEVLESLESMGLEYKITPSLVRGLDYYSRTVFEISTAVPTGNEKAPGIAPEETPAPQKETATDAETERRYAIASGGRYDGLARTLGGKRDVPAMGGAIGIDRVLLSPEWADLSPRIVKKPKVFFIQLGSEAKFKSMTVIEVLRKAKIPVSQSLSKDGLSHQLGNAERLQIPYAIILGQREIIDGTVIVRNMETRSQETVPLEKLAEYVKANLK